MDIKSIYELKNLIQDFYQYAKSHLQFTEDAKLSFFHSKKNAQNPLGKTAFYNPTEKKITIFITDRHTCDVLKSMAHELVHHMQNCRGDLQGHNAPEGYAQTNTHLRQMEEEAYLKGNMIYRDFRDNVKKGGQK